MTQRLLHAVPAAILMTSALAWGLPAAAQGSPSGTPPQATSAPAQSATGGMPATQGRASGLPADLVPAMPATPASDAASAARRGGGAAAGSGFGPRTGTMPAPVNKP